MSTLGYGLEDVRAGLRAVNANSPKGELSGASSAWTINATDQLFDADQYRPVIVAYQKGAPIRLGDFAEVVSSVEDVRTGGVADGKRAVVLVLFRQPGANMIETVDRVHALLPELRAAVPSAIKVAVVLDRTTSIRAAFADVKISLLIAVALVVLVVFVFLRSVSATIIPSVAVPLSLVGTVRGHVPPRLQPGQPLADGLDHLDGLRGRRRDRRPREHHALHRGGRVADGGGA